MRYSVRENNLAIIDVYYYYYIAITYTPPFSVQRAGGLWGGDGELPEGPDAQPEPHPVSAAARHDALPPRLAAGGHRQLQGTVPCPGCSRAQLSPLQTLSLPSVRVALQTAQTLQTMLMLTHHNVNASPFSTATSFAAFCVNLTNTLLARTPLPYGYASTCRICTLYITVTLRIKPLILECQHAV